MSISDLIVVMREGVVQQIGRPQEVYDNPVNLFVAKFLGTPPINVFSARIQGEKLYIGEDAVLNLPGMADREVVAAVRPEGFVPRQDGELLCRMDRVEVMGRDISVVCRNEAFQGDCIRAIVGSEHLEFTHRDTIRFHVKEGKLFLFDGESGSRIRF